MPELSRRSFIGTGLIGLAAPATFRATAPREDELPDLDQPIGSPESIATDEAYWRRVAAYYRVSPEFTNLEAGFFGMMAAPVLAAYHRHIDRVNLENSYYARRGYDADVTTALGKLAAFLGASTNEIAFTRGATEALQCLISQYNRLKPGDVVMYADLDYGSMQMAMNWLVERRGVQVARLTIPEPATRESVLAAYASALAENPRVRLLLVTHLNNKTGLILPLKEIVALARQHDADVIVDAAHSFGQVDIKLADLGADFVGMNLHKWIGAPVGVGAMYIKETRLQDIDRTFGDDTPLDSIKGRVHSGTANFANFLTVPAAIDFHMKVGPALKAARLRFLRDRWVAGVRGPHGVDVLTPDDPTMVAAITSFRIKGRITKAENDAVVRELLEKYGLFTVWRTGLAKGDCIRATPALYNTPAHTDRFAKALREIAART
jgi:isopenicillin-N epimerase